MTKLVIPARMGSTRLPRKPLLEIMGMTLIERTCRQALEVFSAVDVIVATDHEDIGKAVAHLGVDSFLTTEHCLTGTDRVALVSKAYPEEYIVNLQGDEPIFPPEDIDRFVRSVDQDSENVFIGFAPINSEEEFNSTSTPKVVLGPDNDVLYASRAPIPGSKDASFNFGYRQICIYGFSHQALMQFCGVEKTPLELVEDIEMLRFLERGIGLRGVQLSDKSIPVDNPSDIARVEQRLLKF